MTKLSDAARTMGRQHCSPAKQDGLETLFQIPDKKKARSAGLPHHI